MKQKGLFITLVIIIILAGSGIYYQGRGVIEAAAAVEIPSPDPNPNPARSTAAEPAGALSEASTAVADLPADPAHAGDKSLFIYDESSIWTAAESGMVSQVLSYTYAALAQTGLDGWTLLDGYRFRRIAGEYVGGQQGLIGAVDHNSRIISLSDAAFKRLGGFYIYHELGHAVDYGLDRHFSEVFHRQIGAAAGGDGSWQTAAGYWLRDQARDDREEATADAFALWVSMEVGGLKGPVFAHTPVDVQVEAIALAAQQALTAMGGE